MTTYKKIEVRQYGEIIQHEAIASGAITPGMILERTSAAETFKAHATAGGHWNRSVALTDYLQGSEIGTVIVSGARFQAWITKPGDQFYGLLANGENVAIGDKIVSNGDGYLKKATADSSGVVLEQTIIGYALEAVDMSDSSAADPTGRILVEVV